MKKPKLNSGTNKSETSSEESEEETENESEDVKQEADNISEGVKKEECNNESEETVTESCEHEGKQEQMTDDQSQINRHESKAEIDVSKTSESDRILIQGEQCDSDNAELGKIDVDKK